MFSLFACWFIACLAIQATTAEEVTLRVMNYNVRQLPIILGFNNWDQTERLKRLPDAIRLLPEVTKKNYGLLPEVMFFNELMTSDSHWKIKEELENEKEFFYQTSVAGASCKPRNWDSVKGSCDNFSRRSGVMAISRLPILEKHAYIFKNCDKATWDCKANKGAVYIKVEKSGHMFHLVGTHLQADEVGDEETAQVVRGKQMQELRDWLRDFNIPVSEPIILIGDLNVEYGYPSANLIDPSLYQFDFKNDAGFGTFSAPTNDLALADAFGNGYDMNYDRVLDFIAAFKDHKLPRDGKPAWMEIHKLKASEKWYWSYLNREFDIPGRGKRSIDGFYNDVSDHWPVAATYTFDY